MSHKQRISTFLGIAAGVVLAANSYAADIFVNCTCGNDAWSGLTDVCIAPDGPKATIQAGITVANPGDVVSVAEGECFENINFFGKAITVRSTDPNDPVVVMHTIINGGGSGSVVTCTSGEGSDTVLRGFVITGGNAPVGGGMMNSVSSPTVTNCSFIGNTAISFGGGMNNSSNSNPTVTNCSFIGNTAGSFGGGMFSNSNSSPTVTNCSFSGNSATTLDGGGMHSDGSSPTVTDCTFSGNSAGRNGGGMINTGGSSTVTNCTFSANTAVDGGGMFNEASSPTLSNCSFSGNTATIHGGGIANQPGSNPTLTNCSFSGNTAFSGGGIGINSALANATVSNTGFCDNTPDQISGAFTDGGGNSLLYCPPSSPKKPDACPTDSNGDGVTNVLDLIEFLLAFGTVCP